MHTSRAQTASSFSLEYTAPAMCPDQASFVAAIVDRAPQAREVTPASASFKFVAHLEASGALARGYVSVQQQDGSTSRRDVADAPCSEVVESMALILSLILAGSESSPSAGEPAPPPALPPIPPAETAPDSASAAPPPADPTPVEPAPVAAPPPPTPPPPARPTTAAQPRAPATTSAETSERVRLGALVGGLAETGVAPSVAFGGEGGLDIWWARQRHWSPSARLSGRYVRSGLETTDDGDFGSARFRLAALRAELCPVRWPARSRAFGRVCALFDAGQLEVNPQDTAQGETQRQTMPWFGGGGSLRLEAEFADFVSLETAADLVALGRSDRFIFEPGSHTLHQVPRISATFSLRAVLRLP